jgi:conjugative relaxase-like TrwC/TraI family protein
MDIYMMVLKRGSLNAAQAETYYEEKWTADDYYSEGQRVTGQWIGKGAAALGLVGEVKHEDFSALLQGLDPHTSAVLVAKAGGYDKHAAGWDAVFNAPKSVSSQFLIGGDQRIFPLHMRSVERAVAGIEAYAMARQHGGREFVNTANIVGAAFTHVAARPVEKVNHGPDPHLHTHVPILNVTRRPDGALRALSPVEIYRAQQLGSAIYRSEMSQGMQELGYRIYVTASDGRFELEGYTRDQVMAFSSRRQQIEQKMEQLGVSGAKAAQIVTLSTRQAKEHYDENELKAEWKERAAEYGIDARQLLWEALGRGDLRHGTDADAREALDFAIADRTDREAVVDRRALEVAALRHGMGRITIDALHRHMERFQADQRLIPTLYGVEHPQGAFTTPAMLAIERENVVLMQERRDAPTTPISTHEEVQRWAEARRLSTEQIATAHLALSSGQGICAIEGYAGTAKTYTGGSIREFLEEHGYQVRAFAVTSTAKKELRAVGFDAQTIASLLSRPTPTPTGPDFGSWMNRAWSQA